MTPRAKVLPLGVYRHDTGAQTEHRWSLRRLLLEIRRRQPRRRGDANITFALGERPESIAVSTDGPQRFVGQYSTWKADGTPHGAMLFDALTWADVSKVLKRFFAGRPATACFVPHEGRLKIVPKAALKGALAELHAIQRRRRRTLDDDSLPFLAQLRETGVLDDVEWQEIQVALDEALVFLRKGSEAPATCRRPRRGSARRQLDPARWHLPGYGVPAARVGHALATCSASAR